MIFLFRVAVIHSYAVALRDEWLSSFGGEHLMNLQSIKKQPKNSMTAN